MNGGRIVVRLTIFLAATLATGVALWIALFLLALSVFDEPTPECTDSDTCGAWGDFAYHMWPGGFVCFAVAAVIWWLLLRPMRRRRSLSEQDAHADS
jgi:hypothetical protein